MPSKRKLGSKKAGWEVYSMENRRARNAKRKLERHLSRHPEDPVALKAYAKMTGVNDLPPDIAIKGRYASTRRAAKLKQAVDKWGNYHHEKAKARRTAKLIREKNERLVAAGKKPEKTNVVKEMLETLQKQWTRLMA